MKEESGSQEEQKMEEEEAEGEKVAEETKEAKGKKGRKRSRAGEWKEGNEKSHVAEEPYSPLFERPSRDRKSVDRYVVPIEKEKARELKFEKGSGIVLKDIPNVVFKVSKKKGNDDLVQLLHKLLYGKKVKPFHAKMNILQFSGYVWISNKEKEKAKMKERLEKCNKDSLFQVAELLDIIYAKSERKEDIVVKLMEFLESPHKTRDVLMQDNQNLKAKRLKGKKRKRESKKGAGNVTSAKTPQKSQKKSPSKVMGSAEEDDGNEGDKSGEEEEAEEEEPVKKKRRQKGPIQDKKIDVKVKEQKDKRPAKTEVKKKNDQKAAKGVTKVEMPSSKAAQKNKKMTRQEVVIKDSIKEAPSKENKTAKQTNVKGKGKAKHPTDEELRGAICDLLKEADFSAVTFSDVVNELEQKFNVDLTQQRGVVKALIREEINKIAEEEAEEGEDTDAAVEKDKEESDPGALSDEGVEN